MANDIKVVPDQDFEKIQIDPSNLGSLATAIRNYTSVHNPGYTPAPVGTPTLAKQNQQEAIRQFEMTNQQNMQKWMFDNGLLGLSGAVNTGSPGYSRSYSGSNNVSSSDYNEPNNSVFLYDGSGTIGEVTDDAKRRVADLYKQNLYDPSYLENAHEGSLGNIYDRFQQTPFWTYETPNNETFKYYPYWADTTADDPVLYTILQMRDMEKPAGEPDGMGSKWVTNNADSVADTVLNMGNINNVDDYMADLEGRSSNMDAQSALELLRRYLNK